MVLSGQYLERPALISCGTLTLEGLYHRGRRAPALLCCPPVESGGMDSPPLAELAWACARAGHASLRFQYRGFGASDGVREPTAALEDAEAALAHLGATAHGPLAVAGLGSGCATALALVRTHPEVAYGVLLVPDIPVDADGLLAQVLVLLPENGAPIAIAHVRGAATQVIRGADRRFTRGLPELGRAAVAFLETR